MAGHKNQLQSIIIFCSSLIGRQILSCHETKICTSQRCNQRFDGSGKVIHEDQAEIENDSHFQMFVRENVVFGYDFLQIHFLENCKPFSTNIKVCLSGSKTFGPGKK